MDFGKPQRVFIVEPDESERSAPAPAEPTPPTPEFTPEFTPEREPEKSPVGV